MSSTGGYSTDSAADAGWLGSLLGALLRSGSVHGLANLLMAARFVVKGESMLPNFAMDQYVLVSRLAYQSRAPSRGDVVVLRHPGQPRRNYIKRIVGLPGERVQAGDGRVRINGEVLVEPYLYRGDDGRFKGGMSHPDGPLGEQGPADGGSEEWFLEEDRYFVMGDNRQYSDDSRAFGPVGRDLIVGKAWIRYWPRDAWGFIR